MLTFAGFVSLEACSALVLSAFNYVDGSDWPSDSSVQVFCARVEIHWQAQAFISLNTFNSEHLTKKASDPNNITLVTFASLQGNERR